MPSIHDAELTITTDRPQDQATLIVSCNVHFTEVEVNAMNILGLRYTLHCQVLNKELLDEDPVASFRHQSFPRNDGAAREREHAVFETRVPMGNLHERLIGKDKLVAQLKLKNEETHEEEVKRTDVIAVDLAA
jgi:hypothetical protein